MPHIRVDPDGLRDLARRFSQIGGALRTLHAQLSVAWGRLNADAWEGAHRSLVEPWWWSARVFPVIGLEDARLTGIRDLRPVAPRWQHRLESAIEAQMAQRKRRDG